MRSAFSMRVCSVAQLNPTLCNHMDCSPPGSSVHGILQARIHGLPCPPPGDLPDPGIKPMSLMSPALAGGFFTTSTTRGAPSIFQLSLNITVEKPAPLLLLFRYS